MLLRPGDEVGILLQPRPERSIAQPLGELVGPAFAYPDREERAPAVEHRGVGILVRGDVQPALPRVLELRDEAADAAPVVTGPDLEVEDVDRELRFLGDADGKGQFLRLIEALAADVRRVVAAVGRDHAGHLEDLARLGRAAALEPRDQTPCAFLHRPGNEIAHPCKLLGCGRRRVVTFHDAPHLFRRDVSDHIDRGALPLQAIEVAGKRCPVRAHAIGAARIGQPVTRRHRRALAHDVERDALPDLALRRSVGDERHFRMSVEIDEAWSDDEALDVDRDPGGPVRQLPDGGDAIALEADVSRQGRSARAIEHLTSANQHVELRCLRRPHPRRGCATEHHDNADKQRD
jgi:hypothetical protein